MDLLPVNPLQETMTEVTLTTYQTEILPFILRGYTIEEMAKIFFLSKNGIKARITGIYSSFGVKSREGLLKKATTTGLHYQRVRGKKVVHYLQANLIIKEF